MKSRRNFKITLKLKTESISSWIFDVVVFDEKRKHTFVIELEKEYKKKLVGDNVLSLFLIQESVFFLLERESASSILKEFNLKEISNYFPEYEEEIKKSLKI